MAFQDVETYRRAWARSSLGAHKRLGKSYSVLSVDRAKLALPVMSKKRNRMDTPFQTNIMEVAIDDKDYDDQIWVKAFRNHLLFMTSRLVEHDYVPG